MKRFAIVFLLGMLAGFLPLPIVARWGPSGCATVVAQAPRIVSSNYQWVERKDFPGERHLMLNGSTIGSYSYEDGFYRKWDGKDWSEPTVPPVRPPIGGKEGGQGENHFGLDTSGLHGVEKVWDSTRVYTFAELEKELLFGFDDDSKSSHLTAIVKTKERKEALEKQWEAAQLQKPELAKVRLQVYDFSDRINQLMLAPFRLEADTKFQEKGEVLLAQGPALEPEGKAKARASQKLDQPQDLVEALRPVDPNYDPSKIYAPTLPRLADIPWEWVILGILVVVVLIAAFTRPRE